MMQRALALAHAAAQCGEVPVGALIVHQGIIIAQAHNQVEALRDATAHAEMLVIREASRALGSRYLSNCELIVTLEPCAMCAQAMSLARIGKLTFGAYDAKSGGVEHGARIFQQPTCHHAPEIIGGVMEAPCTTLLRDFFVAQRNITSAGA